MHIVVAGAGIAGLTAALTAAELGAQVTVADPATTIGGMLRTSAFAGRRVDEGADAFLVRRPAALALARKVGLDDHLVHPARREASVWHHGALRRLPPNLLGVPVDLDATEASGLLSSTGMARLRADTTGKGRPALPDHDVSVSDALTDQLGPEVVERITEPLVGAINAGTTDRQSLAAVVPDLDAALREPGTASIVEACRAAIARNRVRSGPDAPVFAAPVGGIAALTEAVRAAAAATGLVEFRLGVRVETIASGPIVGLSDGSVLDPHGVVVATPGSGAASIIGGVAPGAAAILAAIDHASVAIVRLALHPESVGVPLDGSGVLLPRDDSKLATACSWTSSKWAHLAPEHGDGTVVLRCALGRDGGPTVTDLDDDTLLRRALEELTPVLELRGEPTEADVCRWPDAFPQYRPGHLERIAAAEEDLTRRAPTVALAGMYLRGVGIPAAVETATTAARRAATKA